MEVIEGLVVMFLPGIIIAWIVEHIPPLYRIEQRSEMFKDERHFLAKSIIYTTFFWFTVPGTLFFGMYLYVVIVN